MKNFVKSFDFSRGLQTKGLEDGLPYPEFVEFKNVRTNKGVARRRPGMRQITQCGTDVEALSLNGSSQYATGGIDTRVWELGTTFSVEGLIQPSSVAGTDTIVYAGVTTPSLVIDVSGGNLRARVWDSGATLTTVTGATTLSALTTYSFQLVRDGSSLTLRLNNVSDGTGSMSATNSLRTPSGNLEIGRDGSGNFFAGIVDYLRVYSFAKDNHSDRLIRFPDPKIVECLADYVGGADDDDAVLDRSRYENHLETSGSPSNTTALSIAHAPVQAVEHYQTPEGRRAVIVAGGRLYDVEL